MGDSSKTPEIPKSGDQVLVTPEANIEKPKDHHDGQDDPPPQTKVVASKAMDVDVNPADNLNLPNSILASSLVKATEETPPEKNNDDIANWGESENAKNLQCAN